MNQEGFSKYHFKLSQYNGLLPASDSNRSQVITCSISEINRSM